VKNPARTLIFKPDGIGDFVLATGAIHTLASEYGEETLTLCVRTLLAPLAGKQFPRAKVIGLPLAEHRQFVNLFAVNAAACLPAWHQIRAEPFARAICFRNMRAYLHTALFYSARTRDFFACENLLARNRRASRVLTEKAAIALKRPTLIDYPEWADGLPTEIEANRLILSAALRRGITDEEILPRLIPGTPPAGRYWLCSPISKEGSKNYPAARWKEIFVSLAPELRGAELRLTGSSDQREPLEILAGELRASGLPCTTLFPPDLNAFVDTVAGAEMVLSVDTAAAHIATALDRDLVVLFSRGHRGMFGPWRRSTRQRWLESVPPADGRKQKWFESVPPARAIEAARDLASSTRR